MEATYGPVPRGEAGAVVEASDCQLGDFSDLVAINVGRADGGLLTPFADDELGRAGNKKLLLG